jgi:hypothetical protein
VRNIGMDAIFTQHADAARARRPRAAAAVEDSLIRSISTMARGGSGSDAPPAPLVNVVVATFNSRLTLACALDSVRRRR